MHKNKRIETSKETQHKKEERKKRSLTLLYKFKANNTSKCTDGDGSSKWAKENVSGWISENIFSQNISTYDSNGWK